VFQVFGDQDFLGWYTTGEAPNEDDVHVQKQVMRSVALTCNLSFNEASFSQIGDILESPLLLLLNPLGKHAELPITLYESVVDIVEGQTR
jgi:COP9 signalosome complex subunit 6